LYNNYVTFYHATEIHVCESIERVVEIHTAVSAKKKGMLEDV